MTDAECGENAASPTAVLAEFVRREPHFQALCSETKALIGRLLLAGGLKCHSVQSRVKTKEKLKSKYSDNSKGYSKLADMTDLVGLRIITYYDDEVDEITEMIKQEFSVDSRSVDKRVSEPDRFGYFGMHLICRYSPSRLELAEYKAYADDLFEVQITSILRHAWSEMEHDWYDMKEKFPAPVKRRFYRLAALLEIAEQEFVEIRKLKKQLENVAAARVEAEIPTVPIDEASLRAILSQELLVAELDIAIALILGGTLSGEYSDRFMHVQVQLLAVAQLKTVEELRAALKKYNRAILDYVEQSRELWRAAFQSKPQVIEKGVCVFQLAFMLVAAKGAGFLREAMVSMDMQIPPHYLEPQVEIAQRVIAERAASRPE
jgi:putative GTP pyrophosphokinase